MPFAQRHPRINFVIGLVLLVILVFAAILLIWFVFLYGRYKNPLMRKMTEFDMFRIMSDFSKGLTLWNQIK